MKHETLIHSWQLEFLHHRSLRQWKGMKCKKWNTIYSKLVFFNATYSLSTSISVYECCCCGDAALWGADLVDFWSCWNWLYLSSFVDVDMYVLCCCFDKNKNKTWPSVLGSDGFKKYALRLMKWMRELRERAKGELKDLSDS